MIARVLFVCTGNICRSPTAEAVFRHMVEAAGLAGRIEADSAGTHGYHLGEAPDPRAVEHGARRGYDLAPLRARTVDRQDFQDFDLLLAMDRAHLAWLQRLAPQGLAHKAKLFLDFAPGIHPLDMPDPYYGEAEDFEYVIDLAEAAAKG
ncbi:MAG TPA: low molecular weight protein-tyrosine-phosphatase, partial [Alphaproteobacteria bacterium]|nr:low molecular weight protein-tyrosine-phosphatase [Alphaproteobacteria bacterium]